MSRYHFHFFFTKNVFDFLCTDFQSSGISPDPFGENSGDDGDGDNCGCSSDSANSPKPADPERKLPLSSCLKNYYYYYYYCTMVLMVVFSVSMPHCYSPPSSIGETRNVVSSLGCWGSEEEKLQKRQGQTEGPIPSPENFHHDDLGSSVYFCCTLSSLDPLEGEEFENLETSENSTWEEPNPKMIKLTDNPHVNSVTGETPSRNILRKVASVNNHFVFSSQEGNKNQLPRKVEEGQRSTMDSIEDFEQDDDFGTFELLLLLLFYYHHHHLIMLLFRCSVSISEKASQG